MRTSSFPLKNVKSSYQPIEAVRSAYNITDVVLYLTLIYWARGKQYVL